MPLDEWVGPTPLIQACLYDATPYTVAQVHLSIDLVEVPATYDPLTHLVSFTPSQDLPEGAHDASVFVLYSNSYTAGKVWAFRSDYKNPLFQFIMFPYINDDPEQIDSANVVAVLLKRYDPQYHLDPTHWTAYDPETFQTYHPDATSPLTEHTVKLVFGGGGLPDKRPGHYEWRLSGRPGQPPTVLPPSTDPPGGGPEIPWCAGPHISGPNPTNPSEDFEWHFWGVVCVPAPDPPGTKGYYTNSRSYTYWTNPIDTDFSKDENNQPWSVDDHFFGRTADGSAGAYCTGEHDVTLWKLAWGVAKYHEQENYWCQDSLIPPITKTGLGQVIVDFTVGDSSRPTATFQLMRAQDRGTYDPCTESPRARVYPNTQKSAEIRCTGVFYEWFRQNWQNDDFKRLNGGRLYLKIVVDDADQDQSLIGITANGKIDRLTFGNSLNGINPPPGSDKERCFQNGNTGNLEVAYYIDEDPLAESPPGAPNDPEEQGGFGPNPPSDNIPKPPNRDLYWIFEKKVYFLEIGINQFDCVESNRAYTNHPYYFLLQDETPMHGHPNWRIVSHTLPDPVVTLERPALGAKQYVNLEKDLIEAPYPHLPAQPTADPCREVGGSFRDDYGDNVCLRARVTIGGYAAGYTRIYATYDDLPYHWFGWTPNNPGLSWGSDPIPATPPDDGHVASGWDNHRVGAWSPIVTPLPYPQPPPYNYCLGGQYLHGSERFVKAGGHASPMAFDPATLQYDADWGGKAWCRFDLHTSAPPNGGAAYAGDNFRLKVCIAWDPALAENTSPPNGYAACKGPSDETGEIWNWRRAWLWPTQMPGFSPLPNNISGAFDDGFVEVIQRALDSGDLQSPINTCPDLNLWAHEHSPYPHTPQPYAHPPPMHSPHHAGIDMMPSLGWYCGENHSFTAVGLHQIDFQPPTWVWEDQVRWTDVHEVGHNLGLLYHLDTSQDPAVCAGYAPKDRSVMGYSCGTLPWYQQILYYSITEIGDLRVRLNNPY